MLGLLVSVPIACWRKGHAREYLETESLPPPATCYGFLLALIGEEDRKRHIGARVTAGIVRAGEVSAVLRTLWRIKDRRVPPGTANNLRPDFQQLATGSLLTIWVHCGDENAETCLEKRVRSSLTNPGSIDRFGGLSLGESTHLVDAIDVIDDEPPESETFLLKEHGRMNLPVWVDHVGSASTRYAVGDLVRTRIPMSADIPLIRAS
jgi:CRISPR-associated protein Cas5t